MENPTRLSSLKKGQKAQILQISETNLNTESPLPAGELERRLLEMGFSEGSQVTLMHEAPFGKDPIIVLLRACHLVALRKKEAAAIMVNLIPSTV
ncbi:MAG: FeoA family protein [Bdellovibrionota bacterium]